MNEPINNRGLVWTRTEVEQLKTEINERRDLDHIVAAHGRTPYAIIAKLQMMGLLVLHGRAYHLVNPEPWTLVEVVRAAQKEV
jgi:hypothetical protein